MRELKDQIRRAVELVLAEMKKGEYDHLGTFKHPSITVPKFDKVYISSGQNGATGGYLGIWAHSEKWDKDDEGYNYKVPPPDDFLETLKSVLDEMGLAPEPGWKFEGGTNFITNSRDYGEPWKSVYCINKKHSEFGGHFVLVKNGKFNDGKEHTIADDEWFDDGEEVADDE